MRRIGERGHSSSKTSSCAQQVISEKSHKGEWFLKKRGGRSLKGVHLRENEGAQEVNKKQEWRKQGRQGNPKLVERVVNVFHYHDKLGAGEGDSGKSWTKVLF